MSSGLLYADYLSGSFGRSQSNGIFILHISSFNAFPSFFFYGRLSSTRATLIALFCTSSEVFDVPVYWPILVVYFFVLFALTMRRQIQ